METCAHLCLETLFNFFLKNSRMANSPPPKKSLTPSASNDIWLKLKWFRMVRRGTVLYTVTDKPIAWWEAGTQESNGSNLF